nr:DUF362 domain-containing protein [Candidatus Sigynarchaeota archaeon]
MDHTPADVRPRQNRHGRHETGDKSRIMTETEMTDHAGHAVQVIPKDDRSISIEKPDLVAVVKVDDYEPENVKRGIQRVMELLDPAFLKDSLESKTVFIKVNGLAPFSLACSHPTVVEELGKYLQAKGCKKVLVGDSTFNKIFTAVTLKKVGLAAVAERLGNPVVNFFEQGWKPVSHASFKTEAIVSVPEAIAAADIVINQPRMKTHAGCVFTGAIKNFYGLEVNKNRMHAIHQSKDDFQRLLGDIHQAVLATGPGKTTKPVLHLLDGIVGMEGKKGPSAGKPRAFKVLIGSFSPAALDTVAFTLMGGDPTALETIHSLATRNNWPASIDALRIVGDDWRSLVQKAELPPIGVLKARRELKKNRLLLWATKVVIRVNHRRCKKCLTCVKQCPVGALSKQGDKIVLDETKCINCFCCGECCPNDALAPTTKLHETLTKVLVLAAIAAAVVIVLYVLLELH